MSPTATNDLNFMPPHGLCPACGHFICSHSGYPGRISKSLTCTHRTAQPTKTTTGTHVVYDPCQCEKKAQDISG